MDLHTLPPSYEAATGMPVEQNGKTSLVNGERPSAPLASDDEIRFVPHTTPILPQSESSASHIRPYNPLSTYPDTRPSEQTNAIIRNHRYEYCSVKCVCFFVIAIVLAITVAILIGVMRSSAKAKVKAYGDQLGSLHTTTDANDKWFKDNQELLENIQRRNEEILQRRREDSQWNFKTNYNNNK